MAIFGPEKKPLVQYMGNILLMFGLERTWVQTVQYMGGDIWPRKNFLLPLIEFPLSTNQIARHIFLIYTDSYLLLYTPDIAEIVTKIS